MFQQGFQDDDEEWLPVPSVPGLLASAVGRLKAEDFVGPMPYGGVRIYRGKPWFGAWTGTRFITNFRGRSYKVARLVCEAFHGPAPSDKPVCMHLDENARNNRADNLAWGTQKQNLNAPGFLTYCRSRTGSRNPFIVGRKRA